MNVLIAYTCPMNCNSTLILTKHALQRLTDRKIPEERARQTFLYPDSTKPAKNNSVEYKRRFETYSVSLVCVHKNNESIAVSVWRDPPAPATADERYAKQYSAYKTAGFWGKFWIIVRQQLGF